MNKLIRGKRYNTETARRVGAHGAEELYTKRSGEFFLAMQDEIRPITPEEAAEWGEKYLSPEEYKEIFAAADDSSKGRLGIMLPPSMIEKLRRKAQEHRISTSEYLEKIIEAHLKEGR